MISHWAKFAGFSAILAVALAGGLTWVLPDLFPPNPAQRAIAECSAQQRNNISTATEDVADAPNDESKSNKERSSGKTEYECLVAAYTAQLAWFTELLAFVTTFLIAVGIYQGIQLKRSVDAAEKSDVILERAYVWPGYGLLILDQSTVRVGIHLGVRNTGRTAGIIKTVHHALLSKEEFEVNKIIAYYVFNGREDAVIPDPNVEVRSGVWHRLSEMPKVSCGWITYIDVFGTERRQGYKYVIDRRGRSDSLPGCFTYEPWKEEHRERPSEQEPVPAGYITTQIKSGETA
jgi:hypothetical protein